MNMELIKTVYVLSNAYDKIHPDNRPDSFKVNISENIIRDLRNHTAATTFTNDLIFVAIRAVHFKISKSPHGLDAVGVDVSNDHKLVAIESDLRTEEHTCFDIGYENIIFKGLVHAPYVIDGRLWSGVDENPVYFPSTVQQLAVSTFRLCMLNSGRKINFIDENHPTTLEILIKTRPVEDKMDKFIVTVKSSDATSKKAFADNSKTNFSYKMSEYKNLKGDWRVSLRSLIFSKRFWSLPYNDNYWIKYGEYEADEASDKWHEQKKRERYGGITIPNGHYFDAEAFLDAVKRKLTRLTDGHLNLVLGENNNKVLLDTSGLAMNMKRKKKHQIVEFSKDLALRLGWIDSEDDENIVENSYLPMTFSQGKLVETRLFHEGKDKFQPFPENVRPRQIILNCSIIEPTIYGDELKQILHLIPIDTTTNYWTNAVGQEVDTVILSLPDQHLQKMLSVKYFNNIKFWLEDENGRAVKIDDNNSTDTFLTLSFINVTEETGDDDDYGDTTTTSGGKRHNKRRRRL